MGNPKPKYAVSDFELQQYDSFSQYEPTASANAEAADSELEPPPYEPSSSRREEDEAPLVECSSKSNPLFNSSEPNYNPISEVCEPPPWRYCGMSKRRAWTTGLVVIAMLALVLYLGLEYGPTRYKGGLSVWDDDAGVHACGHDYSTDTDHVVTISHYFFNTLSTGSNQTASPVCGHKLRAKGPGNSLTFTVVDRCDNCNPGDINIGNDAKDYLVQLWDPPDSDIDARPPVTWHWLYPIPSFPKIPKSLPSPPPAPPSPTLSDLYSTSPNRTRIGSLSTYDGDDVHRLCTGNVTSYGVMIDDWFFDASVHEPNTSYTDLCGHKIWASGAGYDGKNGSSIPGTNLTLTVIGSCPECDIGDLKVHSNATKILGGVNGTGNALQGAKVRWHFL